MNPSRRKFIKDSFKTGSKLLLAPVGISSLLSSCISIEPPKVSDQSPIEYFNAFYEWYKSGYRDPELSKQGIHRLYNGKNPNHDQLMHSFKGAYLNGWTPGHGYVLSFREDMISMISGTVVGSGRYNHSDSRRARGLFVDIQTPTWDSSNITVQYGHLEKVHVKTGQKIKRGEPIGYGTTWARSLKIMLFTNEWHDFHEDPDNYGVNYEHMNYLENISQNKLDKYPTNQINKKRKIQDDIYRSFESKLNIKNGRRAVRRKAIHFSGSKKTPIWSLTEKYRFLETLYNVNDQMFPDLSSNDYQLIRNDFYKNQPFILTLPIRKK